MKKSTPVKIDTAPLTIATKTPAKKAPKAKATPPPVDPLAGVTIRAEVVTYTPTLHRPRVYIRTPTAAYYKLVPSVRTTTKAEALAVAHAYREAILGSGEIPPKGERQPKAPVPISAGTTPRSGPRTVVGLQGVTRIDVD